MTLIIGTFAPEGTVLASDMRLSWNGEIRDDSRTKLGFYSHFNVRALFGYTGLAKWNTGDPATSFNTLHWLTSALNDASKRARNFRDMLLDTSRQLQNTFENHPLIGPLASDNKRLSILFQGFQYISIGDHLVATPIRAMISNVYDANNPGHHYPTAQRDFFVNIKDDRDWWNYFPSFLGATVPKNLQAEIATMVAVRKSSDALRDKSVSIIQHVSDLAASVGKNILVATLLPNPNTAPHSQHIDASGTSVINMLAHVVPSSGMILGGIRANLTAPKKAQPSQNSRCFCGSGLKYKRCHGKLQERTQRANRTKISRP